MPKLKRCAYPEHRKLLPTEAFDIDNQSVDGLQAYCKDCKAHRDKVPKAMFRKFQYRLKELGQDGLGWDMSSYVDIMERAPMGPWTCSYCGNDVRKYGAGYALDRINSAYLYTADNVTPCCWPCNNLKKKKSDAAFRQEIASLMNRFPAATRGGVLLWEMLSPDSVGFHVSLRDRWALTRDLVVEDRQITLFE